MACCVFAALLAAADARADFASSNLSARPVVANATRAQTPQVVGNAATESDWNAPTIDRLTPWNMPAERDGANPASNSKIADRRVLTVPPGPDSTSLFFSALAGIGVWHLGKNVRKLNFSALPEWYHAGGPAQVGCATPLDLDFSLSALTVCAFEGPTKIDTNLKRGVPFERRLEIRVRIPRQDFSPNADPRGPPSYT